MSTECKICEGTGNEPGELGCVWCDDTGKAGGLKPAPSDELAAFRAYMAANPMATFWSVWQERAKFITAELQASHQREAALQELLNKSEQLADDLQAKLGSINRLIYAVGAPLGGDVYFSIREICAPYHALATASTATINQHSDGEIPDFSPGNGNKARRRAEAIAALRPENQRVVPCNQDANEPPCPACFIRGCNGECMENL